MNPDIPINAPHPTTTETPYGGTLKGIFTVLHWAVPLTAVLCGGLLGASLAFAPVQAALVEMDQNCTLYTAESTCAGASKCQWRPSPYPTQHTPPPCAFVDGVDCSTQRSAATCSSGEYQAHCTWLPASSWCVHQAGYSSVHLLLLYGTLLFGAALGALLAHPLLHAYGLRRSILSVGYLAMIACAGVHASTVTDTPFILMAARGLLGVACGVASCAGPLLVFKRSPASYQRIGGVLFHVGTTIAAVVCGFVGLVVAPQHFDSPTGMHIEARKEALASVPLLYSVGLVILGHMMPTGNTNEGGDHDFTHEIDEPFPVDAATAFIAVTTDGYGAVGAYGSLASPLASSTQHTSPASSAAWRSPLWSATSSPPAQRRLDISSSAPSPPRYLFDHARPVLMALLFAAGDQLTGNGAMMLVAPTITTTSVDATPLTGNFFLQVWCFSASIVSLLLVLRANMRNLFSVGLGFVMIGCGVVAAASWQGMLDDDDSRRAAIGLGVALFIGGYEMGVGPMFYPLSIAAQPATIRTIATCFTMAARFLIHTAVVVLFPIAATNIFPTTTAKDLVDGGQGSGNGIVDGNTTTRLGLSVSFAFFSVVAAACGVAVLKALPRCTA